MKTSGDSADIDRFRSYQDEILRQQPRAAIMEVENLGMGKIDTRYMNKKIVLLIGMS